MTIYSSELNRRLRRLVPGYVGAVPIDKLPPAPAALGGKLQTGFSFIVNNEPEGWPGGHWMAVAIPPNSKTRGSIFIDPLAMPLHETIRELKDYYKHVQYRGLASSRIQTLPYPIQHIITSKNCGLYCAFILTHLPLANYDLNLVINRYFHYDNLNSNDRLVEGWWRSLGGGI